MHTIRRKENLHRSFPLLLLARFRLRKGILTDCRLAHASESSIFFAPEDASGLNNNKLSLITHMSMWRSIDCIPGDTICAKIEKDGLFSCNPPMYNQSFVDARFYEKKLFA